MPITHIWPWEEHIQNPCRKGPALTSDLILSERLCTYIRPHIVRKALHLHQTSSCQKGSLILSERIFTYIRPHLVRKALHLYLIMWEHILQSHQNGSALIYDHVGTHPTITLEWIFTNQVGTHPIITSECLCTDHVGTHTTIS